MAPNQGHDETGAATVAQELSGLLEEIEDYVEEKVVPILETFEADAADPEPRKARPAPEPRV
jgi:hypothetical protein